MNLFLKERWVLQGLSLRKKGSFPNSRRLSTLVEAITSLCDGKRWEGFFEQSKGENSTEVFKIFRVDEKVLSSEEDYPFAVAKVFSGFGEKIVKKSLSDEVNISFNFSLIFLEEVSMTSLRKEEVVRLSVKIVSSM